MLRGWRVFGGASIGLGKEAKRTNSLLRLRRKLPLSDHPLNRRAQHIPSRPLGADLQRHVELSRSVKTDHAATPFENLDLSVHSSRITVQGLAVDNLKKLIEPL